jgi:hypothetical protein
MRGYLLRAQTSGTQAREQRGQNGRDIQGIISSAVMGAVQRQTEPAERCVHANLTVKLVRQREQGLEVEVARTKGTCLHFGCY